MTSRFIHYVMEGSPIDDESGIIELIEPINLQEVLCSPQNFRAPQKLVQTDCNELLLVYAPSHTIPTEMLRFFRSNISHISSVKILRHAFESTTYCAVLTMQNKQDYELIYQEYHGQILSAADESYCILLPILKTGSSVVGHDAIKEELCAEEGQAAHCPVCLDPFDPTHPMSFTTGCNHRFHMQCMLRLEGGQCPVCRFQHDSEATLGGQCFVCGWQGAHVEAPSSLLECAVDSTGAAADLSHPPPVTDLWQCLICGFTGCGVSHGGHIQRHYEETLHSYAQNCSSQQVWDFSGDNYVHKLILNDNESRMVNMPLDVFAAYQRDLPPLNGGQETSLVSAKLEAAARHYNQLLAWQMEQNRLLYETRLQRIRESIPDSKAAAASAGGGTSSSRSRPLQNNSNNKSEKGPKAASWRENMLASLRTERSKVLKQLEGAGEKLARAQKEVGVLQDLNAGLTGNREEWQRRVDIAAAALKSQEAVFQLETAALEERVSRLMGTLDQISRTETGSKHATAADGGVGGAGGEDGDDEDTGRMR